jgi:hypothetical protein
MPVHSHDGAKRLEPKGMRKPAQQLIAPVVMNNCLNDDAPKRSHSRHQPWWYEAAV